LYSENGWPTFESPISAARNVLDMLVQSWGGTIRVFPACPKAWGDVQFSELRTEGAFLVSAVRRAGRTEFVRIKSLAGEPCRLRCDLAEPVRCLGPGVIKRDPATGLLQVTIAKGAEVVLYSGADGAGAPLVVFGQVLPASAPVQPWGLTK
jgi:hypothetical protein